jgi:hypothetical protein
MHSIAQFAAAAALLVSSSNALLNTTLPWPSYIKYETVTGYFLQDDPSTNPSTFDYVRSPISVASKHIVKSP